MEQLFKIQQAAACNAKLSLRAAGYVDSTAAIRRLSAKSELSLTSTNRNIA